MSPEKKEEIKNRNPDVKKAIKVYTIELLVFAVVFITLGVLELFHIIGNNEGFRNVFTYITLVGASLLIADLIWALASKKRRRRVSLFDKFLILPGPIAMIVLGIITLVNGVEATKELHHYMVGAVFIYLGLCYCAQAIYHYFYPIPMLIEELEAEKEEEPALPQEEKLQEEESVKEESQEEKKEEKEDEEDEE